MHPFTSKSKAPFLSSKVEQERSFFRDKTPFIKGLRVICGGRENCRADYVVDRENFSYHCIEWVAAGRGTLELGNKTYLLQPGSLFIYKPGIPHRITTHPTDRLTKYFVDFEGPSASLLLRKEGLQAPAFHSMPSGCGILEIFDRLVETGAGRGISAHRLCCLLLECLVVLAATHHPKMGEQESRAYATFLRCQSYMEQHLRRSINMETIAKANHVDPAYLSRLFKRFAGESPHLFFTRMKMKGAALQLARQRLLVKEVAHEFGYADAYHFSKTFKKSHGIPPEKYLQSHRL